MTTPAINGAANTVTWTFDGLGRVSAEQNLLETFTYTYDGTIGRVATVTYPNGQSSAYSYFDNANDRRLQTIHHKYPNGNTLSKFDYTYDPVGNILTWRQQAMADTPERRARRQFTHVSTFRTTRHRVETLRTGQNTTSGIMKSRWRGPSRR